MNWEALGNLSFEAMVVLAENDSPLTRPQIAEEMKCSLNFVNRIFNVTDQTDKHYFIAGSRWPELSVRMQTSIPIDWMVAQYHRLLQNQYQFSANQPIDCQQSFQALVSIMKEVGEMAAVIEESAQDGLFSAKEIRRINREVSDVIGLCFNLMNGLTAYLDENQKGASCKDK